MKHFISSILLFVCLNHNVFAQDILCKDSLIADFARLTRFLEETHPDPYTGFGGRYFFRKEALRIENILRNQDTDLSGFSTLITSFLANIGDGHTSLFTPNNQANQTKGFAAINARVIPDGLIVSGVIKENEQLLGSRILGIEGVPIAEVLKKFTSLSACENEYGAYLKLANSINGGQTLSMLFPELGNTVTYTFQTVSGDRLNVEFPFISGDEWMKVAMEKMKYVPQTPVTSGSGYMFYGYADDKKDIMRFRLLSIMARENFRFCIENGWDGSTEMMKSFYAYTLGKEMPADIETALQGIPSFSETFFSMLQEMKTNNSQTLIIDLRGNGGGWTPITLPSLYMLFGDDYLTTKMDVEFSRMVSPLLLKKQNMTLEKFNSSSGYNYKLGDFTIPENDNGAEKTDIVNIRKGFVVNAMSEMKKELEKQNGKPVYKPAKVYVVTDAATFSAAFHYAFYLWKMGATIVGVPCHQSPNTFMEGTPFQLPYTRLEGTISNSMQIFLPGTDARAKVFWPDMMPDYEDYCKYNFDSNMEVLWLLDKVREK